MWPARRGAAGGGTGGGAPPPHPQLQQLHPQPPPNTFQPQYPPHHYPPQEAYHLRGVAGLPPPAGRPPGKVAGRGGGGGKGGEKHVVERVDHTYRDFSTFGPDGSEIKRYRDALKRLRREKEEAEKERERLRERAEGLVAALAFEDGRGRDDDAAEEDKEKEEQKKSLPLPSAEGSPGRKKSKKGGPAARTSAGGAAAASAASCRGNNFPAVLHRLLADEGLSDVIAWLPHGRAWKILSQEEFCKRVLGVHFAQTKYSSFSRQVNGWGFKRITKGPDANSYYHELFLRWYPHLVKWIKRVESDHPSARRGSFASAKKGKAGSGGRTNQRRKLAGDPRNEPDFYVISDRFPLTNFFAEGKSGRQAPGVRTGTRTRAPGTSTRTGTSSPSSTSGTLWSNMLPPFHQPPYPYAAPHHMHQKTLQSPIESASPPQDRQHPPMAQPYPPGPYYSYSSGSHTSGQFAHGPVPLQPQMYHQGGPHQNMAWPQPASLSPQGGGNLYGPFDNHGPQNGP